MTLEKTGEWQLGSGTWQVQDLADRNQGPQLVRTSLGHPLAPEVQAGDIARLMQTRGAAGGSALYPPEFQYAPCNGAPLAPLPAVASAWIPPSGASAVGKVNQGHVVGLRRSAALLQLRDKQAYHAESDPGAVMPLPPRGDYQFFSSQFGTQAHGLLALDPEKGGLFAWLPASACWAPLHGAGGVFLAETSLPYAAWRAELDAQFNSRLFVATDAGLACLTPDLPALQYQIEYAGAGAALGAPLTFQGQVWAPVLAGQQGLEFVSMDGEGRAGVSIQLTGALPPLPLPDVAAPVSYGRLAIWPSAAGQLVLQRKPDGSFAAQFLPWPQGLAPQFLFGTPYLANDGDLWQLCFDSRRGNFAYAVLGKATAEVQDAQGPRLCSGTMHYRFATKHHQAPWTEPEHADDSAASTLVIPLLEVGPHSTVGIRLHSTAAMADTLRTTERLRVQLVWDDHQSETVFNTSVLPRPWTLRLFVHDDTVWAYHPELKEIIGWKLSA